MLCLSYTDTYDYIAAGFSDGTIRMIKASTGENTSSLRDPEMQQNPGPTTAIKHRPVHKTFPITQTILATCTISLSSIGESRQPWAGACLGPIVFFFFQKV